MNSLKYIQGKVNNGYILAYISDDYYNSLNGTPLYNDIYKYDIIDFMSFDGRESNYITGIISINPKISEIENYSLAIFPIHDYIKLYIDNDLEMNILEEMANLEEIVNDEKKGYEDKVINLYEYIDDRFFNIENSAIISLTNNIIEYNYKHKNAIGKQLLLTNCEADLSFKTIINYINTLLDNIRTNSYVLNSNEINIIGDIITILQKILTDKEGGVDMELYRDTNYILETVIVDYILGILNIDYTDNRNISIINACKSFVELLDPYELREDEEYGRYEDNRYKIISKKLDNFEKLLISISSIK